MHGSPPLKEKAKVAETAQSYANYLALNNLFLHSDTEIFGENLGFKFFDSSLSKYFL